MTTKASLVATAEPSEASPGPVARVVPAAERASAATGRRGPWRPDARVLSRIAPAVGVAALLAVFLALRHELAALHYHDAVRSFRNLSTSRIALAAVLTAASYFALTGYDFLALRYVGRALSYTRIGLASFVGYVVSHNLGLAFLGGSAIRYRMLSAWGLGPLDVVRVIGFNVVTFWLGFLTMGSAMLWWGTHGSLVALGLPPAIAPTLAVLLPVPVVAYLRIAARGRPVALRGRVLRPPSLRLAVGQTLVSAADWILAASVLYVLLPSGVVSLPTFTTLFLVAQLAGMSSHLPAGIGVFDATIVLLLAPFMSAEQVVASVLAYRFVYYLVPLLVGAVLLAGFEVSQRREQFGGLRRALAAFTQVAPEVVARIFALTTAIAGALLLASGATPAVSDRMAWLGPLLPLPVIEVSHFAGSLVGIGLLLLARSLQQRVDAAYPLTVGLLLAGIVVSLLKGFDYEEALVLGAMLACFLPCRRFFRRRASLSAASFSAGWTAMIVVALAGSTALVLWSYRHVEYSNDLWWSFAVGGHASRSLRAGLGAVTVAVAYALARLMRPATPATPAPGAGEMARLGAIVAQVPAADAHLALLSDKALLWNAARTGFVMYAVSGRSFVSMGDPVGPADEIADLAWRFRAIADDHGGRAVFYQVGPTWVPLYLDLGMTLRKLGEKAFVPLDRFSLKGDARKTLRGSRNAALRDGAEFSVVPTDEVPEVLDELEAVSDEWLSRKHTREKGFSLGFFGRAYLLTGPVAVVRRHGRIVAFANLWEGGGREELSVDLMRFRADAPRNVMDFLFTEIMLWGQCAGFLRFDLGMAPLAGLEHRRFAPLWNRCGALLFRYGENFYNFRGLRDFKDKFDPLWAPRYLAYPGGALLPRVLTDVAALIAGGLFGVVTR